MTRLGALISGASCVTAFAILALIVGLTPGVVEPLDVVWNDTMVRAQSDVAVQLAHIMNVIGGGWVAIFPVPIVLAVAIVFVRGWRTAIVAIVMMLTSIAAVQIVKSLVARDRPGDMLVSSDFGSFPSGHTANAATVAVVLVLLLPRAAGIIVGIAWVVMMAASRTILSAHWLTDTIGGALVGAGVALLVLAALAPWARIRRPSIRPKWE